MYTLTPEPQPQPHDSIIPMYTLTPEPQPQPQPHDSIIPVLDWSWGILPVT